MDHKKERSNDVEKIKNSNHPRKVIVAGPGTGKSYLFSELIKQKLEEEKNNFLAITFIGKLGDSLADDLCGLARTMTLHGYAREFVLSHCSNWLYYPRIYDIIKEDLNSKGIEEFEIGDSNYKEMSKYFKAIGDDDVLNYAVQICKNEEAKIPIFDLILIDEYQDFNSTESEFVDLLAQKNEIVIVGDDDQALYEFKGSSPKFIRSKYSDEDTNFESHTLRFCSRCTEVIIKSFHNIILNYNLESSDNLRINKDYIYYSPDKESDSKANPRIHLIKGCPPGMISYKIFSELKEIADNQKIKDVLILGEGRSCKSQLKMISNQFKNYGFRNINFKGEVGDLDIKQDVVEAYKIINKDESSILGWRILGNPEDEDRNKHIENSKTLNSIITGTPNVLSKIKEESIRKLETEIENDNNEDFDVRKNVLFNQIKRQNIHLQRPICNLEITICNILNSKGLGADVVFLVGFDNGKLPSKAEVLESEIYQILVALTRAKKRIYLINTVGKTVSDFINCIEEQDIEIDNIN